MPRARAEYDKVLDQLATMLRRKPRTARAVAEALGCSRPVAYARLEDVKERLRPGERLHVERVRESVRGPPAVCYSIRSDT